MTCRSLLRPADRGGDSGCAGWSFGSHQRSHNNERTRISAIRSNRRCREVHAESVGAKTFPIQHRLLSRTVQFCTESFSWPGRHAGPWMCQPTGPLQPGQRNRSPVFQPSISQGGLSSCTCLISHGGTHASHHRKASVIGPPTFRSSRGLMVTEPGALHVRPFHRALEQRKRVVAKHRSSNASDAGSMRRSAKQLGQ